MYIGSDSNFLSLEKVQHEGPTLVWRFLAGVAGAGCIAAVHGEAEVITTDETPTQIADFRAHRAQKLGLVLSEGGWLRIRRVPSGRTLVRYRVCQLKASLVLEGDIRLEAEPAEAFCRELGELL
jgi:hypothetical protein